MQNDNKTNDEQVECKKGNDEDWINAIIRKSISKMLIDIEALDRVLNFNDENPRKLAMLVNARTRIQQQVYYGIALLRDPKLKLSLDGKAFDFANMMKRALEGDSPSVKKMVEEAKKMSHAIEKTDSIQPGNTLGDRKEKE